MKKIITITLLLFSITSLFSRDYYWVSNTTGSWDNPANWSSTSGGPGGTSSFPIQGDDAYFNMNGAGECQLTRDHITASIVMINYPNQLNVMDYELTVTNWFEMDNSSITAYTNGKLITSGGLRFEVNNSDLNVEIDVSTLHISTQNSVYHKPVFYHGRSSSSSSTAKDLGNNTYYDNVIYENIEPGTFTIQSENTYHKDVTLSLLRGYINFGSSSTPNSSSTTTIKGDFIAETIGNLSSGEIKISNSSSHELIVKGTTTINNYGDASIILGAYGNFTADGNVFLNEDSHGDWSRGILVSANSICTVTFNHHLYLSAKSATSSYPISFGKPGYSGIASTGTTICNGAVSVNSTGVSYGRLTFENFTQTSANPCSLQFSNHSNLIMNNTSFNGELSIQTPYARITNTEFQTLNFKTTNTEGYTSFLDGVIFKGSTKIENVGNGDILMGETSFNTFKQNLTLENTGPGTIKPSITKSAFFSPGDGIVSGLTIHSNKSILFGESGGGISLVSGSLIVNTSNSTPIPTFNIVEVATSISEYLVLHDPIVIEAELKLKSGIINCSKTSVLTLIDNAIVTSASHRSYVNGPIKKIGNDSFTFPVGKDGFYAPISIASNSLMNSTDAFQAEYFHNPPSADGFNGSPYSFNVSAHEYWMLERKAGTTNVSVNLGWESTRSGTLPSNLCKALMARWNGTSWVSEGNGGVTGDENDGSINSGKSYGCGLSEYVASWTDGYPLTFGIKRGRNSNRNYKTSGTSPSSESAIFEEAIQISFSISTQENELLVSNPSGIEGTLRLFNMVGQLVWVSENISNQTNISIPWNTFKSGIYFVSVVNHSEMIFSEKVVKP